MQYKGHSTKLIETGNHYWKQLNDYTQLDNNIECRCVKSIRLHHLWSGNGNFNIIYAKNFKDLFA